MKKISYIFYYLVIIFSLSLIILNLFGYRICRVTSDSMMPIIRKNDLVIIKKVKDQEELHIQDIIVFQENEKLVFHEIIKFEEDKIITKGRANNSADKPITFDQVKGVHVFHIPFLGIFFSSIYPWLILFLLFLLFLIIKLIINEIRLSRGGNNETKDKDS